MDRHQFDAAAGEARAEALITETRAQFSALTRAVLAEDPVAVERVDEALGHYLMDDNARKSLVQAGFTDRSALQKVLTTLAWEVAGDLAEAELAAKARASVESHDDDRISWAVAGALH